MEDFLQLNTQLTTEEKLLQASVEKFVDHSILSIIADAYETATFPRQVIKSMATLGLLGMTLPENYGGSNASYVAYGLACQALERGDSGIRSFASVQNSLCMYPIFAYGNEKQKTHFLPKMAAGNCIGCFGLTEPDAGSDPSSMRTNAKKVDGGWLLNGSKMWITNAPLADIAIIWAQTAQGPKGIRGFIVEKNTEGYSTTSINKKMSLRASSTGAISLQDCLVPDSHYLPGSDTGLAAPLGCLNQARYGIAWGAMGAAQACYDAAVDYVKTRQQFNKPVASFQLVQKELADMLTEITKTQCLNFQLGKLKDEGKATATMISMAKANACREALKIARAARNLLGANGISLEYPVIRHMNNLESVFTYEGTDNVHILVLGKHITGINAFS